MMFEDKTNELIWLFVITSIVSVAVGFFLCMVFIG